MNLLEHWKSASNGYNSLKEEKKRALPDLINAKEGEEFDPEYLEEADNVDRQFNPHTILRFTGGVVEDFATAVSDRVKILFPHEDQGEDVPFNERIGEFLLATGGEVLMVCSDLKESARQIPPLPSARAFRSAQWEKVEGNKIIRSGKELPEDVRHPDNISPTVDAVTRLFGVGKSKNKKK